MLPDSSVLIWFRSRAESANFSLYLCFALLVFILSYFFLDYAKYRNNIYYALFAFPALVIALPAIWGRKPGKAEILLVAYFLCGLLAEWLVGDPVLSLLKHQLYLLLLFCGLRLCIRKEQYFQRAALMYFIVCTVLACVAGYRWLEIYSISGELPRIRLVGAASNPVHASLMIMTGWLGFWMVYGLSKLHNIGRLVYLAGFSLMLGGGFAICIVFQSRSALLGLSVSLAAWLILGKERLLSLVLIVFLALLMFVYGGYEALLERGASYRTVIWQEALVRLYDSCSWVFGCRDEGWPLYSGKFHHAHSAYISILTDTGLLGALSFVVFACAYLIFGIKTRSPWFMVSLLGWGGVIASSNGLVESPRPLWIYFWLPTLLALLDFQRKPDHQSAES
jgi:hypothetical protein